VLSAIYLASLYKSETEIKLALLNFLESVVSFIDVKHMDVNLEERLFRLATLFDKDVSPRIKREATKVAFLIESQKLGAQMSTRVPPFKAMPTNAEMLIAAPIMTPRPKISFEQLELNEILNENFGSSNAVIEDIYGRTAALYKQIPFSLFISPTQDHPFFTHLHKLTLFALQRILEQKKTVYRKRMQDYFIKVAYGLVEQGDFSSSFALYLGITHSAIERLTLAASPVLKSLKELFALENNHAALRARIDARLKEKQEKDIPPLFLLCKDVEAMKAVRSENSISHEKLKGLSFLAWRFQNPKNYLPEEKPDRTDIKTRLDNCDYSEDKAAERSRHIKK
jgi:hypothetical protein